MTRRNVNPWLVLSSMAAALGALSGCSDDSTAQRHDAGADGGADTDTGDGGAGDAGVADPLDDFFGLGAIHDIDIEVDDAGVQALVADPYSYVHGAVRIDDAVYEDVGVRLKGGWGSFVPIDADTQVGDGAPGKSAFIVKFNEYVPGQKHLGLKKLTINNNVQDGSYIHQYVGYALFRELGVPASRAGFARVRFDGADKGVYTLVESTDNHPFLDRWYGAHDGHLYEGEYGVDLTSGGVAGFDQDNGDDTSRADLSELVAALDAIPDGADPLPTLDARFDFDEYLRFAAAELYLGHWDGYAWWVNNYLVHHDLATDKWTFVPWGIDQIFGDALGTYDGVMQGPGPAWGDADGFGDARMQMLCFRSAACLTRLRDAFADVLDAADAMDLRGLAEETWAAVDDAALAETSAWGDPTATIYAVADTSAFIVRRRGEIERWLPCLEGAVLDGDGDGFDGCTEDCDDGSAAIFPGAEESCNGADDDCNGAVDDAPECPQCLDAAGPDGRTYALCSYTYAWADAEATCEKKDARLAALHDADTAASLFGAFSAELLVDAAWIGLGDTAEEGTYAWVDGSGVDYTAWADGEPGDGGEDADCVVGSAAGWSDAPCGDARAFVCAYVPQCDAAGEVWDPAAGACVPWACGAVDLGAYDGAPISASGDTCVGTSIFADGDTGCTGWNAAEREIVYSLELPAGASITVAMTPTDAELDASLTLLADCADFDRSGCLAGSDVSYGGGPESLAYANDTGAPRTVYISADAYSGCGAFDLSVI